MAVVVLEVPMVVTHVLEEQEVVETLTNQELPIVVVAEAEESLVTNHLEDQAEQEEQAVSVNQTEMAVGLEAHVQQAQVL